MCVCEIEWVRDEEGGVLKGDWKSFGGLFGD